MKIAFMNFKDQLRLNLTKKYTLKVRVYLINYAINCTTSLIVRKLLLLLFLFLM